MEYQGTGIVTDVFRDSCVLLVCIRGVNFSLVFQRHIFYTSGKRCGVNLINVLNQGMEVNLCYKFNRQGKPWILAAWVGPKPTSAATGVFLNVAAIGLERNLTGVPTRSVIEKPRACKSSKVSAKKFPKGRTAGRERGRSTVEMPVLRPVFFERGRDVLAEEERRYDASASIVIAKNVPARNPAVVKVRAVEKLTAVRDRGRSSVKMPVLRPVSCERRRDPLVEEEGRNVASADIVIAKDVRVKNPSVAKIRALQKCKREKGVHKLRREAARKLKKELGKKAVQKPVQNLVESARYWPILPAKHVRTDIYYKRVAADQVCADKEYKGGRKAVPRNVIAKNYGDAGLRVGFRNRRVNKGALKRKITGDLYRVGLRPVVTRSPLEPQSKGKREPGHAKKVTLGEYLDNVTNASGTVRLKVAVHRLTIEPRDNPEESTKKKAKKAKTKNATARNVAAPTADQTDKPKKPTKKKAKKPKPKTATAKNAAPKIPPLDSQKPKPPGTSQKAFSKTAPRKALMLNRPHAAILFQ